MSGTLGDMRPEIEEMERATGNKVRVWETPNGELLLDFSTPGGKRPNAPADSLPWLHEDENGDLWADDDAPVTENAEGELSFV